MKKTILSAALLLCVSMPAWADDAAQVPSEMQLHKHWSYTGSGSAPHWGDMDEAFDACKTGLIQSPVNIDKFVQGEQTPLQPSYSSTPLDVVNNGHTIQLNIAPGSTLGVDGKVYNLLQLHFHTPSEHYIDGAPYPMEAHFAHQAEDGELAVIGVMIKVGTHNPVVEGIWQNAPAEGGEKIVDTVMLSAADLMPASLDYYKYEGSLTTPPCSEGVQWYVLKDPIEISQAQLTAFQTVFPVNARPIQNLNDRFISGN